MRRSTILSIAQLWLPAGIRTVHARIAGSTPTRDTGLAVRCGKVRLSIFPTSRPIRRVSPSWNSGRQIGGYPHAFSAYRCCARARRSGRSTLTRTAVRPFTDKQIELVHDLRRPGGDRDRERPPVRRDPGQEPPARRGERAQVALPRQHEPRAAHAAQRHPRLYRAHPGQRLWRAAREDAVRAGTHPAQRQASARADQRRARSFQDRGRAAGAEPRQTIRSGTWCTASTARSSRWPPARSSPSRSRCRRTCRPATATSAG